MVTKKILMVSTTLLVMTFIAVLTILSMLGGVDNYTPATENPAVVFAEACARCHGERGMGGSAIGPRLAGAGEPADEVKRQVMEGHGRMPSFPNIRGRVLENLVTYVNELGLHGEETNRQTEP